MKPNQKIDSFCIYFLKKSWWAILVVVIIGWIFFCSYPPSSSESAEAPHLWEWFERMFAYITFLVAMLLWWGQKHAEWIDYLPNRLTVTFYCKNDNKEYYPVMQCKEAILSNESDIRALSQAIGMQMNGGEQLEFIPAKVEIDPYELDEKRRFLHYRARIYLSTMPNTLVKTPCSQGQCLVWGPDFDVNPKCELFQS